MKGGNFKEKKILNALDSGGPQRSYINNLGKAWGKGAMFRHERIRFDLCPGVSVV